MEKDFIKKLYGKSVRLRVCGLYVENDRLLMIKHLGLGEKGELWIPPGGGVNYGSSIEENLQREFAEETGLQIVVEDFLFLYEYIKEPLHAVELFYRVSKKGGTLQKGFDPEYSKKNQIIDEVKMLTFSDINRIEKDRLHGVFSQCQNAHDIINLKGFFKFENYT